jgi:hypothetical protein
MTKTGRSILTVCAVALIAACGGGGGDSGGSVASTSSFPLQSGYSARLAAGATDNLTVSGSCAGTATMTTAAATAATFEGIVGYAVSQTVTTALTGCALSSGAVSGTAYFDSAYAPLGSSIIGVVYATFVTVPPPLPAAVTVGATAVLATLTTYTDSTKTVTTGQRVLSYVIEADTANTAIVNLIARDYNASNQLLATQQTRLRIAANGTLTMVSIDVQYSTTSTAHLVYTKV